jgi:acetyl esterase/lipase
MNKPLFSDQVIEAPPSGTLRVRVYGPAKARTPVVLHLHGGAFAGSVQMGHTIAEMLAQAGATVLDLDYPNGIGHPFPQALEAAYDALRWIEGMPGRRRRLFVAGEEAGGNLAAALALVARDRRSPVLAGQILFSPMLDPQLATCSIRNADAGAVGCKWADGWRAYLGTPDKACHPYAAPSIAQRLAGLPPALVLTGPQDPMHDEAELYAGRLGASGVAASCVAIRTGPAWPNALLDVTQTDLPWRAEVREALASFLQMPGATV